MTLLRFTLQPGQSIFEQVVFAAIKAFVSGEFQPGQAFPSVRALAASMSLAAPSRSTWWPQPG